MSAKGKKHKLDDALEGIATGIVSEETVATPKEGSRPTSDEFALFFNNISHQGTKPVILSLILDSYIPKSTQPHFPKPLTALHRAEYVTLNYHELISV